MGSYRFGDLKKQLKAELVRLIDELFDRAAYGLGIIDVVLINSFTEQPFPSERDLDFHQHKFCSELCQMADGRSSTGGLRSTSSLQCLYVHRCQQRRRK